MSYPSVPARTFSASVGDKSNTATTGPDGIETDIDALRTFLTNILTKLQAVTDGDSGADGIGVTAIEGVSGTTVQAVLEAIIALGTGTLPPDGSINNAKLATDVKVGSLASLETTAKASVVGAINDLNRTMNVYMSDKVGYIYTVVDYKRIDGTLFMKSTLSNPDVNGNYQTDTWKLYDADGATLIQTITWTITYDASNLITQKEAVVS